MSKKKFKKKQEIQKIRVARIGKVLEQEALAQMALLLESEDEPAGPTSAEPHHHLARRIQ